MRAIKYILALALVVALVVSTNLMDNTNFQVVKESIHHIYEDRLIAYDLNFKMHNEITDARLMVAKKDTSLLKSTRADFNKTLEELILQYKSTKLTKQEKSLFEQLQAKVKELTAVEKKIAVAADKDALMLYEENLLHLDNLLDELAEIQLKESQRQLSYANRAINSSSMLAKLEIAGIIALGVIIQFLIIYNVRKK